MIKPATLLLFLATAFFSLESCTRSSSGPTVSSDSSAATDPSAGQEEALSPRNLETAKTNYAANCSGCHGEQAATFADRKWKHGDTDDALFQSIKLGHPNAGMPAFGAAFSDEEIQDLVAYIREGIKSVQEYSFEKQESMPAVHTSEAFSFKLDTVVSGLGIPWGMVFLPNGDMLYTEIKGTLTRFTKNKTKQKIEGVPQVLAEGQGGLLDIELHPNFAQNNILYISYAAMKKEGDKTLSTTAVTRAKLEGNKLTNQKVIFEALPYSTTRHHYGSRLEFDRDGNLYVTVGDRGNHDENAQSLERHPGKTHRIKDDGSIPADNPFVNTAGAVASIYTYGNRNAQGMALHPETGEMWEHEHGPRGGDEINILKKGANYGWPVISYGINYNGTVLTELTEKEDLLQPLLYWVPSIGPSGMAFVTGNRYKGWENNLLIGSLRFQYLNRCVLEGDKIVKEEKLLKNIGRVRDVKMAPDGYIYVAVETGNIFRLVPTT